MISNFQPKTKLELMEQNPITLAFLGDAVHSLFIREWLVSTHNAKAHKLHLLSSKIVCAVSQSKAWDSLESTLTQEELGVALRARNAHYGAMAKNATSEEYHKATMLEAVVGYDYLLGNMERVKEILNFTLPKE